MNNITNIKTTTFKSLEGTEYDQLAKRKGEYIGGLPVAEDDHKDIKDAFVQGGRLTLTWASDATGQHVTIDLYWRKLDKNGKVITRRKSDGRVGLKDADDVKIEGRYRGLVGTRTPHGLLDPTHNYVIRPKKVDEATDWAASATLEFLRTGKLPDGAKVFIARNCMRCGAELTHDESIQRKIGPICLGDHTTGAHAPAKKVLAAA